MGEIKYAEDTKPDLEGPHGKAWKLDVVEQHARLGGAPPELTVAAWIVEARWAHPVWHSYVIVSVMLKDHPGVPPAKIYKKGATHEVMVYALDPREKRSLNDKVHSLTPANFAGQWIAEDDATATAFIEETVQMIIDGKLSPDTDYMRSWMHRFGDSMVKKQFRDTAGQTEVIIQPPRVPREHSHAPQDPPIHLVIPGQPGPQDVN